MKSIRQQIIEAKKEKTEREEELWFVDYCNNCKTGLAFKNDVPCHHPYYCWHEGEPAIVQSDIVRIDEFRRLHGHITAQMYVEYKQLRKKQRQLVCSVIVLFGQQQFFSKNINAHIFVNPVTFLPYKRNFVECLLKLLLHDLLYF